MNNHFDEHGNYINCENLSLAQIYERGRKEGREAFISRLIDRIIHHKAYVSTNDGSPTDEAYKIAHDHIIEVIRQEAGLDT